MRRLQAAAFLLIIALGFSACGTNNSTTPDTLSAQPAISIAQRYSSILTPTSADAPEIETPISPSPTVETPPEQPTETEAVSTEPTNTNPPPAQPTLSPTNTLFPTESNPTSCDPSGDSALEVELIGLINQERIAAGLGLLTAQAQLTTAARLHSDDMACNGFFSHTSPTNGTFFDRIAAAGYIHSWAGENLAAGYATPAEVVESWMASEGHRENILNDNYTEIGVGYAYWSSSDYDIYWTVVFASP